MIQYREDIDALRGGSVLLVVVFHAFPGLIPGGYIGVDVFSVISGFLITAIILSSIRKNNFSILGFYVRRIRKLFPALITVLSVALINGFNNSLIRLQQVEHVNKVFLPVRKSRIRFSSQRSRC